MFVFDIVYRGRGKLVGSYIVAILIALVVHWYHLCMTDVYEVSDSIPGSCQNVLL